MSESKINKSPDRNLNIVVSQHSLFRIHFREVSESKIFNIVDSHISLFSKANWFLPPANLHAPQSARRLLMGGVTRFSVTRSQM